MQTIELIYLNADKLSAARLKRVTETLAKYRAHDSEEDEREHMHMTQSVCAQFYFARNLHVTVIAYTDDTMRCDYVARVHAESSRFDFSFCNDRDALACARELSDYALRSA